MIEIPFDEFERLSPNYPSFFDTNGQKYLVLDGNILIVRPTNKEYGEEKEKIEQVLISALSGNN